MDADAYVGGREVVELPLRTYHKYSEELVEEFCGLIADGLTIGKACQTPGMPAKRTIQKWIEKYPEFRQQYYRAVVFRNECYMDDCIDIADDTQWDVGVVGQDEKGNQILTMVAEKTNQRKVKIDTRWRRLEAKMLKEEAKLELQVAADGQKIEYTDPIYGQLYQWEIEIQKRRIANGGK